MNDREAIKDMLLQETAKCRACRFCVDVCPTYQAAEGVEAISAFGRLQILRYLLLGMLTLDDALVYSLYSCLHCKRCEVVCKSKGQNLDIGDLLLKGRALLSPTLIHGKDHGKI